MATQCSRTLIISICNLFLSSYLDTYSNLPFLGSYQQSSCLYTGSYAEPAPFYYSPPVYVQGPMLSRHLFTSLPVYIGGAGYLEWI